MSVNPNTPMNQKGSTLIYVMIMLVMLTVVGVLSIRTAMTTLNMATNVQVGQSLSQTADTPLNLYANNPNPRELRKITTAIGYAEKEKADPGKEFVFCYRPLSANPFASARSVVVLRPATGGAASVVSGSVRSFCDLEQDFGSRREAVVTQVAVKIPNEIENEDGEIKILTPQGNPITQPSPSPLATPLQVRVTTTSVFPNFAADVDDAQACMSSFINDNLSVSTQGMRTVAQCLVDLGVPVNTQVQEYVLGEAEMP